jgi:hypothetical protein
LGRADGYRTSSAGVAANQEGRKALTQIAQKTDLATVFHREKVLVVMLCLAICLIKHRSFCGTLWLNLSSVQSVLRSSLLALLGSTGQGRSQAASRIKCDRPAFVAAKQQFSFCLDGGF